MIYRCYNLVHKNMSRHGPSSPVEICEKLEITTSPRVINKSFNHDSIMLYLKETLGEFWVYDTGNLLFAECSAYQEMLEINIEDTNLDITTLLYGYENFLEILEEKFGSFWFYSRQDNEFIWYNSMELPKVLSMWSDSGHFLENNTCSEITEQTVISHFRK